LIGCIALTLGPLATAAPEKTGDLERAQALFAAGNYPRRRTRSRRSSPSRRTMSRAYQGRGQARVDLKRLCGRHRRL